MGAETVAPDQTPDRRETFLFTGARGPFLALLLMNLLLTVLTLGIYRFWAKTKVRKFFWSNIRFMGDPLEYTGKGSELFLGFLIVLAVLFPLGFIYDTIGRLVPPGETALRVSLEIGYYLVLFALIQIGFYRAWRYRMSRTTWRGIRLGLDGSTWTFLRLSFGWTIVTALTLGLAYPWMAVELWRYQINHTRIGQTAATFKGSGRDLLGPWLLLIGPITIWLFAFLIALYLSDESVEVTLRTIVARESTYPALDLIRQSSYALYFLVPLAWFWFSIKRAQYQISGISLKSGSLSSNLPFGRLLGFAIAPAALLIIPLIVVVAVGLPQNGAEIASLLPYIFLAVIFGLVIFPMIWTLLFTFELIKQVFITTTITNPDALESVLQSASESQKTGEGLADALDIGGL